MNIIDLSFCTVLKVNSGDLHFICLEAQTMIEKQSSFKVFFITEIDQGVKLKFLRGRNAD